MINPTPETAAKTVRDPRYERWRWTILIVTWLAYVGYYFTRKSFAVAKVGILEDPTMEMTKSTMGLVDLSFGIAYAAGQFLWGMAGDRFGPRVVVLTGMIGSSLVAVLMGFSTPVIVFGGLFFLQGLFQASGWAPLTKNVSCWFSRRERGRVFGFWSTNYAFGGMVASAFAGYVALHFGDWRYAFHLPALVLLLLAVLFFFRQRNRPEDVGLPPVEQYHGEPVDVISSKSKPRTPAESKSQRALKFVREVIASPMILRLGAIYFLLKPIRYALLFWGPVIISERMGTNIGDSAFISAFFEAAGPPGVILAGYVSDKWFQARRMPVIVIGLFGLSLILFSFNTVTATNSRLAMILVLAAIGCFLFGPDSLISATSAVDFGTKGGAGSAAGFINGLGSTGQILGLWLPGMISERYGWDVMFTGMGCFILLAALLLLPKWNAVPARAAKPAS
ncbi:MAG: MFS transporter [Verrucomicrobiae bacterium]|nr:MFS transporter [Verrucomicrobiae bacterium]